METAKIPAVILAGAPADEKMQAKYAVKNRAEIPIAGKPMAQHVLDALNSTPNVGKICVVGDIECNGASKIIPSAGQMMENLIAGVSEFADESERVLVITSDIPMVTPEAIAEFIDLTSGIQADFCYPVISREANEKRFPVMKRTYVKLAEGIFTGGNVVMVNSRFISDNAEIIREALAARKKIFRLAKIIGFGVLLRVAVAQILCPKAINFGMMERVVSRILNAEVKVIQASHPEIGADVDNIEQAKAVEAIMKR